MNLVNTTCISTEDMFNKLQSLKSKTKLEFYKSASNYYHEMNIRIFNFEEYPFRKIAKELVKFIMKY